MAIDPEQRKIGQDIKRYLKLNRISREEFCHLTKLGKSTVDKLCTGIFSEATLQIVLERTKFVRSNSFAAEHLGRYSRDAWSSYLGEHLLLMPSLHEASAIDALKLAIVWDDNLPGMVLAHGRDHSQPLGHISIPHDRSPLIYVAAVQGYGRNLMLSTMVGERVMRGLMLTVTNPIANSHIPAALPIVLRPLAKDEPIEASDLGSIGPGHRKFEAYRRELDKVIERQYGRLVPPSAVDAVSAAGAAVTERSAVGKLRRGKTRAKR